MGIFINLKNKNKKTSHLSIFHIFPVEDSVNQIPLQVIKKHVQNYENAIKVKQG